jgi:C1A family cysteine protease
MPHDVKWYGWSRDLPDHRDLLYSAPVKHLRALPAKVDLLASTKLLPPVYDQGELGSCTGNAIAAAVQFARRKEKKKPDFVPSRLFIYWNERKLEGTVDSDSGAQIRDGMKVVAKVGVCPSASRPRGHADWPYEPRRLRDEPPEACFAVARENQITAYQRLRQELSQMKGCLAEGYPFVFGFTAYGAFESDRVARSGALDLPAAREKVVGGHAVMAVGYDDATQRFLVRNSWGDDWGKKGYFTMPYAYLTDPQLAADFWTIRQTE